MLRGNRWKRGSKSWNIASKKRAACVLLASTGLLLTSCRHQAAIVQERLVATPSVKIDTAWVFRQDTVFRLETDTFLIETTVRDTLVRQSIRVKPYYIKVTDTIKIDSQQTKKENKKSEKRAESERNWLFAILVGLLALTIFWLAKTKK